MNDDPETLLLEWEDSLEADDFDTIAGREKEIRDAYAAAAAALTPILERRIRDARRAAHARSALALYDRLCAADTVQLHTTLTRWADKCIRHLGAAFPAAPASSEYPSAPLVREAAREACQRSASQLLATLHMQDLSTRDPEFIDFSFDQFRLLSNAAGLILSPDEVEITRLKFHDRTLRRRLAKLEKGPMSFAFTTLDPLIDHARRSCLPKDDPLYIRIQRLTLRILEEQTRPDRPQSRPSAMRRRGPKPGGSDPQ